ncbi:hypothetical protein KV697_13780 [Sphingomonas sanguinis]|uniref:hypothetical protein n=1 Tax=Sphingomonas sanguinis TaxID=33051 RepID=UPI001C573792|nr:hypothetical protein [Sphingomonas sanguinis]QXT34845.1 hypothetical protein KV697_13780 [Sphingomonas sanguinis]
MAEAEAPGEWFGDAFLVLEDVRAGRTFAVSVATLAKCLRTAEVMHLVPPLGDDWRPPEMPESSGPGDQ